MPVRYDPNLPDGPEFYYAGNRYCNGDLRFIQRCLMRLSESDQNMAREGYRELYLREGRESANRWLINLCEDRGIPVAEMQAVTNEARERREGSAWIMRRIEELKKAKKANRPRIFD